jgi:hypothetical protein
MDAQVSASTELAFKISWTSPQSNHCVNNEAIHLQYHDRSYRTTSFVAIVLSIVGWVLRYSKRDL